MRSARRVVGMSHSLMEIHRRGVETGGSMRSVMVPVERPSLVLEREFDREREVRRKVKEQALL